MQRELKLVQSDAATSIRVDGVEERVNGSRMLAQAKLPQSLAELESADRAVAVRVPCLEEPRDASPIRGEAVRELRYEIVVGRLSDPADDRGASALV